MSTRQRHVERFGGAWDRLRVDEGLEEEEELDMEVERLRGWNEVDLDKMRIRRHEEAASTRIKTRARQHPSSLSRPRGVCVSALAVLEDWQ